MILDGAELDEGIRAMFATYRIGGEEAVIAAVEELGPACCFNKVGEWISKAQPEQFKQVVVDHVQEAVHAAMKPFFHPGMKQSEKEQARAAGRLAAKEEIANLGALGSWFTLVGLRVEVSSDAPNMLFKAVQKGLGAWRKKQAGIIRE